MYELNHSQSVYHRDYEDKHREKGKKRFLGSESQRLNECLMSEKQKVCSVTGRQAWTFSAGGWKMTTSAVS